MEDMSNMDKIYLILIIIVSLIWYGVLLSGLGVIAYDSVKGLKKIKKWGKGEKARG